VPPYTRGRVYFSLSLVLRSQSSACSQRPSLEGLVIHISFYVDAVNKDQFLAIQQDLLQAFLATCRKSGVQIATPIRALIPFEYDGLDGPVMAPAAAAAVAALGAAAAATGAGGGEASGAGGGEAAAAGGDGDGDKAKAIRTGVSHLSGLTQKTNLFYD